MTTSKLAMFDSELETFLSEWNEGWAGIGADAPISARRATLERLAAKTRAPTAEGCESVVTWVNGAPRAVRVRIFRPLGARPTPALIFMHGGSWMVGSPETHFQLAETIAEKCEMTVFSVDYALAPEHPFPAAIEDCELVVRWVFDNAEAFNLRTDSICIAGESAGANLAAAMTLLFRGTSVRFSQQVLFYPPVDFTFTRSSFVENADGPMLTTTGMLEAMAAYVPRGQDRKNRLVAPLQADSLEGLPPAFIGVAQRDPLRDDGLAYAERLRAVGVQVQLHRGNGLFHGYLRALPQSSAARAALGAACSWLTACNEGASRMPEKDASAS